MGRVELVVLDVNETLSDMEPLRERFTAVGAPAHLLDVWFASTLRDGFALAATGTAAPFPAVARGVLRTLLAPYDLTVGVDEAAQSVLDGFPTLHLHPDVAPGLRRLAEAGVRLVTLTNGSAALAQTLLDAEGVADLVEARLSVDDAGLWKPHAQSYRWALEKVGVPAGRAAMVAVHPWDLHGAKTVGLTTGYVDRTGAPWPDVFAEPDARGATLGALADALVALE